MNESPTPPSRTPQLSLSRLPRQTAASQDSRARCNPEARAAPPGVPPKSALGRYPRESANAALPSSAPGFESVECCAPAAHVRVGQVGVSGGAIEGEESVPYGSPRHQQHQLRGQRKRRIARAGTAADSDGGRERHHRLPDRNREPAQQVAHRSDDTDQNYRSASRHAQYSPESRGIPARFVGAIRLCRTSRAP